ncbi:hypothetical protein O0L34_g15446 [Tuta absoluta]|nr:hypothetical protein O0L34_g15446 [Tuta absoluta]
MALTAAERQKRYKEKIKQNSEKYEEYKKKKRENYHNKKRLVSDLSAKEKYNARLIWRLRKKQLRQKKENLNRVLDITPPSSPSIQLPPSDNENDDLIRRDTPSPTPQKESKKTSKGRKKIKRNRSKIYRENIKLQEENEKLKKQCEKYRKRCHRMGYTKNKPKIDEETKYKKLSTTMKANYQKLKSFKEKRILKNIITQVEGHGKTEIIRETLGITGKTRTSMKRMISATKLKEAINSFFLRDDVSRATAGKKETCTKNGEKMQKRFMLDSMKRLYKTFKRENSELKCSYFYFTKNKPFYVLKPSVSGREMCLCKTHTNPTYKAHALKNKGVINTSDLNTLISSTVCNSKDQACMYGTCKECKDMKIEAKTDKNKEKINWKEWERVEELYEKDDKQKKAFKHVKSVKAGTVEELMNIFNKELKELKKHIYNMKMQFNNFRQAVDNLQVTEAVIVVDFSENYSCKLHEEIQSHHFGGSRQQVSLHTVVVYLKGDDNDKKVESFCTVSANTNHQPAAIWAHLDPILKYLRNNHPNVTTVHFFSDGPFSQYRQKQNFYLSSTTLFDYEFTGMTWSFFEAGHGKGPADGIGGYLKRSADELVAHGNDISSASSFYEALKDVSKTRLYLISSDDITNVAKCLPAKIPTLVGTKHVHQVFTTTRGELMYRNLSCFCQRGNCDCLSPKVYRPVVLQSAIIEIVSDNTANAIESADTACDQESHDAMNQNIESRIERAELIQEISSMSQADLEPVVAQSDSDDNLPLYSYKKSNSKEIDLSDLCQPRQKNWYDIIYQTPEGSEDEQAIETPKPSSSAHSSHDKENKAVQRGDFLLVNVPATKGKTFKYACIVKDLHDDGELRVTFLRSVKKKRVFRLDENDISDIDYRDIIRILPEPDKTLRRGQEYFVFLSDVNVSEK